MLFCDDVLIILFIYCNGLLVCTRSDWHKLETGASKNCYLFHSLIGGNTSLE